MNSITREELKSLAAETGECRVSLYVPLHRRYPHTRKNHLKLAEQLDRARGHLNGFGLGAQAADSFLKPARDLVGRSDYWKSSGEKGLALFLSRTGEGKAALETYRLPYSVAESADVAERFHVTPLVRLLDWYARFHVLALGLNGVELYRCDRLSAEAVSLPADVPASFEEFTAGVEVGRPIQFRSSTASGAGGDQVGIVRAQSNHKDQRNSRIEEFVSHVARAMEPWLEREQAPLVLAAVDHIHPVFHRVCGSRELVSSGVVGSPDEMTSRDIHAQAVERISQWRANRLSDFNGQFADRIARGHASNELESIVPAARHGRVESLLIADRRRAWGRYETSQPLALVHEEQEPGDQDLLDLAVADTLAHGGDVHALDPQHVPDGAPAAAILRW